MGNGGVTPKLLATSGQRTVGPGPRLSAGIHLRQKR